MAAFAQFSSDLDKDTLRIIERGKRMTEALKQPVNRPIPFYKMAALVFCGGEGFLDQIKVDQIKGFEEKLYEKLDSTYADLAKSMKESKKLEDDTKDGLRTIAKEILNEMNIA